MSDHQAIIEFKQLIQSEIGDFFAGFGHLGEPVSPEIMQKLLLENIEHCFAEVEKKWFLFPSKDLVWMTRTEFSHYMFINKMSPYSLHAIRHFVDTKRQGLKSYMQEVNLEGVDYGRYEAWQKEAIELAKFSLVLSREIKKLGGI
ncbi:hypothetical protein [Shewanella xiamenensis]|uniref:hypothetical protein n=1 Tax=Shewanella xiamenensis TaxID=332186 RepID=UPI0004D65C92|nr:hypothetical protein [Shewanella xiamenensis]KEK29112.1 hypothetical protein SXM_1268 [Shewanella xiamenensis]